MKDVLIALVITALAFTSADAQTVCQPVAHKHRMVVKHKTAVRTTTTTLACRMLPFQVCSILPDRRSVSCYYTSDTDLNQIGEATIYGPTGPMPGEAVHFKVRTIVVNGKDMGRSYCVRNKENNATVCTQPGVIIRDDKGYYSYGQASPRSAAKRITAK